MKKSFIWLSAVCAAFIIGCGNNGSSVSDVEFHYDTSSIFGFSKEISYKDYLVEADDDPILHATVKATNCETFEELGNGKYLLKKCIGKPTYIEISNGIINYGDKNVTQTFPLLLNVSQTDKEDDFIVTPITTILATANDENITEFAKKLGVSREDLYSYNNAIKKFLPQINSILILSASQGAIVNKIKFLDVTREELLNNINSNIEEINISNVVKNINEKSLSNPNLFGIVAIKNNIDSNDPLEEIANLQNAKTVRFYGIVFDKQINNANINVKDLDTNISYDLNTSSDENGIWSFELDTDSPLYKVIENTDHILQFIAIKNLNGKIIKLTSTVTTEQLRNLLRYTKVISPTKSKNLIISNVTTAQDAILDKMGALNSVSSYEGNLTTLRIYYPDKLLTASAIIKAVVDNNATVNSDVNNTYDLVKESITANSDNIEINTSIVDSNLTDVEKNITDNIILSSQLNNVQSFTTKNINGFKTVASKSGYVFYRLLAYYKENAPHTQDNFIREYTKIIVYPGYYSTQTCYLEGNTTSQWNCSNEEIIKNSSNFTLGEYEVDINKSVINYSLDYNSSVYVESLNKTYDYFGVLKSDTNLTSGITITEPMILVNNYDVVDAFRRMPELSPQDFSELESVVDKYNTKSEVNYALNRWIKNNFINTVGNYFEK